MPDSPEAMMDFERMLEELASTYPAVGDMAMQLKDEVMDLMPDEEMPEMELGLEEGADLELDLDDEDEPELELEL